MATAKNADRRQVLIPADQWDRVTILAAADRTSNSQIVREALREFIDRRTLAAKISAAEHRRAVGTG